MSASFRRRVLEDMGGFVPAKRRHPELYPQLPGVDRKLSGSLGEHRRKSARVFARKLPYPAVYRRRLRFGFERRVKGALDDVGVWALRR